MISKYGNTAVTRLAAKLYMAVRPSDLMHASYILGKKLKGWDEAVVMKLAQEHTAYAKLIVARAAK